MKSFYTDGPFKLYIDYLYDYLFMYSCKALYESNISDQVILQIIDIKLNRSMQIN